MADGYSLLTRAGERTGGVAHELGDLGLGVQEDCLQVMWQRGGWTPIDVEPPPPVYDTPCLHISSIGASARLAVIAFSRLLIDVPLRNTKATWETSAEKRRASEFFSCALMVGGDASDRDFETIAQEWGPPPDDMHLRVVIPMTDSWRHKGRSIDQLQRFCSMTGAMPVLPTTPYGTAPDVLGAVALSSLYLPLLRGLFCVDWSDAAVIFRNRGNAFVIAAHAPQAVRCDQDALVDALSAIDSLAAGSAMRSGVCFCIGDEALSMDRYEALTQELWLQASSEEDQYVMAIPATISEAEQKIVPAQGITLFAVFEG